MILESQTGQNLVKNLARSIVGTVVPDQLQDFEEIADDYLADPSLDGDEQLGSGFDLIPDLVVVLAFVAIALNHLWAKVGKRPTVSQQKLFASAFPGTGFALPSSRTPQFTEDEIEQALSKATAAVGDRSSAEKRAELRDRLRDALIALVGSSDIPTRTRILFLGANPQNGAHLNIGRELHQVATAIREAPLRDRIILTSDLAVSADDLQRAVLLYRPQFLHFGGHGTGAKGIFVEGTDYMAHAVSATSLARLFRIFAGQFRCIVLNACFSEELAGAMAQHADVIVGMSDEVSDSAALSFSRAFYRALSYGESLRRAFDLGCSQIDLDGFPAEADIPRLVAHVVNPDHVGLMDIASTEDSRT